MGAAGVGVRRWAMGMGDGGCETACEGGVGISCGRREVDKVIFGGTHEN
jgi:hypothetical protein